MDSYAKNFIIMSVAYLAIAGFMGVGMLWSPNLMSLKFVHSHLMLVGWVSMMIYGVGYHILPRFVGKLMKNKGMAELQFWTANIGLVGMLGFYTAMQYTPGNDTYRIMTVIFGLMEVLSVLLFFYNMMVTFLTKEPETP